MGTILIRHLQLVAVESHCHEVMGKLVIGMSLIKDLDQVDQGIWLIFQECANRPN